MTIGKGYLNIADEEFAPEKVALLLAGGNGARLQDLTLEISGAPIPKQYCRLFENSSLLETTLIRTRLFTEDRNINVIINLDHVELAMNQIYTLPKSNILVQPVNRDTGPGIVYSLLRLKSKYPDATVAVFPTDHYIDNAQAFIAHVERATRMVECMPDKIAILGVTPDRPETGYGYLLPAAPVKRCEKTYHVKAFSEKPGTAQAHQIISLGGLWNTFVMVFRLSRMLDILMECVPDELLALAGLYRWPEKAASVYQTIDAWNFSTRVLTRIPQHIIMLEVDNVCWSDWGTRESIERTYQALNRVPFWKHPLHRPLQSRADSSEQPAASAFIA
jgi:mannose-1-phosphate guanylyltransferase